jgi:hypothetical protein
MSLRSPLTSARRTGLAVLAGALLVSAAGAPAWAAPGDTSEDTVVANVGVSSSITLDGLTPSFTLNGLPGDTVIGENAVSYTVNTNSAAGYTVTVQAAADELGAAEDTNDDVIPIENLQVRAADTGAFTSLSNTGAVTLRDQDSRSDADGDEYADDYQVAIPFVADDTYSVTLNYVATAS